MKKLVDVFEMYKKDLLIKIELQGFLLMCLIFVFIALGSISSLFYLVVGVLCILFYYVYLKPSVVISRLREKYAKEIDFRNITNDMYMKKYNRWGNKK